MVASEYRAQFLTVGEVSSSCDRHVKSTSDASAGLSHSFDMVNFSSSTEPRTVRGLTEVPGEHGLAGAVSMELNNTAVHDASIPGATTAGRIRGFSPQNVRLLG